MICKTVRSDSDCVPAIKIKWKTKEIILLMFLGVFRSNVINDITDSHFLSFLDLKCKKIGMEETSILEVYVDIAFFECYTTTTFRIGSPDLYKVCFRLNSLGVVRPARSRRSYLEHTTPRTQLETSRSSERLNFCKQT